MKNVTDNMVLWAMVIMLSTDAIAQSLRPGWGATPFVSAGVTGVTFRVWAPMATNVTVAGAFNNWNSGSLRLTNEPGGTGVWSRDVVAARVGQAYKFIVNGQWKADPFGRAYDGGPTANTVVTNVLLPLNDGFVAPAYRDMVIYEIHIGTFCDPNSADGKPGTLYDAINCLDWVVDMGFNTIQLMPVNEFPHDLSWGYNPVGLLAVESSYGGMNALRAFIAAAHQRGLAVLGDVVANHLGFTNSQQFDLYGFDTTNGAGSYFFEGAMQTTPWGPRPHYGQPVVQELILQNVKMLMDAGMDGIRWDSPQHIFRNHINQVVPFALDLMIAATDLTRSYGGISIAENARIHLMEGFDGDWDYAARSDILYDLVYKPTWPRMGDALKGIMPHQVIPVESHDTCGLLNAGAIRNAARFAAGEPGNHERIRKLTMMTSAAVILSPGVPMLFMGSEWGETNLWHDDRPISFVTNHISNFTRELIRLRRNLDGLSFGLTTTNITVTGGVLPAGIQMRRGPTNQVVMAVFSTSSNMYHRPTTFPSTGHWFCVLSSDDPRFGGQGRGSLHLHLTNETFTMLALPPYGTMVFSQVLPPGDMDGDGLPNIWEMEYFGGPTNAAWSADADGDGMTNGEEWLAGTDPNDSESFLGITEINLAPEGTQLIWRGNGEREHILSALSVGDTNWFPVSTSIYTLGFTHTNLIYCPEDKEACIMFRVESSLGTISNPK